jgi:hypothetical protein
MFGYIPDSLENARFRTASDAAFGSLAEMIYGHPIDDAGDWEVSRVKYKGAYGCFAMSYGLARILVEQQIPFSGDRRAEMLKFVEGVVDTYIRGELADLVGD